MTSRSPREGQTAHANAGDAPRDVHSDRASDTPRMPVEITVFKKSDGILSKMITAATDGSPVSDGSACRMSSGMAKRMSLPDERPNAR